MGQTVSAASEGAPPPFTMPVGVPDLSAEALSSVPLPEVKTEPEIPVITNPGNYEELFTKPRILFPAPVDGLRFLINKGLSSNFQVSHNLHLSGGPQGSTYKFSPTYVGGSPERPQDANPVILAEMDGSGSLTAQVIYNWLSNLKSKTVIQTQQDQYAMVQMDTEYRAAHSSSTVTLGNIDILKESGIIVGHHLHRITSNVDVGTEVLYQYGQQPGASTTMVSLAGRYNAPNWCLIGSANLMGTHLAYYQKANENIQAGVDFEYNMRMQESTVSLVYQVDVPKANVSFKALADTNWTVGSVFEKRLEGLPFTLGFSALLNHQKNSARFGVSLQIG